MRNVKKAVAIACLMAICVSFVACNDWRKDDAAIDTTIDEVTLPDYTSGKTEEIYVTAGASSGDGSEEHPFGDIDSALAKVADLQNTYGEYDSIRVNLSGTFELKETVEINPEHTKRVPLIIKGNNAVISGGTSFKGGWQEYKDGIYCRDLDVEEFRALYVNDSGAVRARFPDKTADPEGCVLGGKWNDGQKTIGVDDSVLSVLGSDVSSFDYENLEIFIVEQWTQSIAKADGAKVSDGKVWFSMPDHLEKGFFAQRSTKKDEPYVWVENSLALLDKEGEWFYDKEGKKLYYKPVSGSDIQSDIFTVPSTERLFSIEGQKDDKVKNVFIEGISFEHSNWNYPSEYGMVEGQATEYRDTSSESEGENAVWKMPPSAVYLNYADNVTFLRCVIRNTGATGMTIEGESNNIILKCNSFTHTGGSGLIFGSFASVFEELPADKDPRFSSNLQKNVTIEDNYFAHIGRLYMGGIGVQGGYASNVNINHNEVHDVGYSGMSLGWGWTGDPAARDYLSVRNNKIYDTMNNLLYDGAGVYFLGRFKDMSTQNKFVGNYVECGNGYAGVYFDEGSNNFIVENNVIEGEGLVGWLLIHDIQYMTKDLVIRHNYTTTKDYKINSWSPDKIKKVKPEKRNVTVTDTLVKKNDEQWSVGAQSIIDNAGIRQQYRDNIVQ